MSQIAEPLQQEDRVFVRWRGRRLLYFAGCDYHRLSMHPRVLAAVRGALREVGLNTSASRKTTGNHALYEALERDVARFFRAERAVLVSNGYLTNLAVAQAFHGEFTHVLLAVRSHVSVADAAFMMEAKVMPFVHPSESDFKRQLRKLGKRARPIVFTDGMFSQDGSAAPLAKYLALLPSNGAVLVDDAHAAGVLGECGRGTPSHCGVRDARVIQTVTLSKAFGTFGGAILGTRAVVEAILTKARSFVGATPVPLPLAAGARAALKVFAASPKYLRQLHANAAWLKGELHARGVAVPDTPGPIVPVIPASPAAAARLRRRLLAAEILPPFIRYPNGPASGYFRFVISSAHTRAQLARLAAVLTAELRD